MSWPQYLIIVLMGVQFALNIIKQARDTSITPAHATFNIALVGAVQAGYAYVLHAGGFW